MKRYHLDYDEKQIVYAMIRTDRRNISRGIRSRSPFKRRAAIAIQKAKEDLDIGDTDPEIRKIIVDKLYMSAAYNQSWEQSGETYCSRGMFYQYRKEFIYLIADNIGLIDGSRRRKQKEK